MTCIPSTKRCDQLVEVVVGLVQHSAAAMISQPRTEMAVDIPKDMVYRGDVSRTGPLHESRQVVHREGEPRISPRVPREVTHGHRVVEDLLVRTLAFERLELRVTHFKRRRLVTRLPHTILVHHRARKGLLLRVTV